MSDPGIVSGSRVQSASWAQVAADEIERLQRELAEARANIYSWLLDEVQHIGDWDGITDQERKELADLMMTRCPVGANAPPAIVIIDEASSVPDSAWDAEYKPLKP